MVLEAGHYVAGVGAAAAVAAEGRNSSASPSASHDPSKRHGNNGDEAIGDSKAGKRKRQHTHPDDQEAGCPVRLNFCLECTMGVDVVSTVEPTCSIVWIGGEVAITPR